MHEPLDAGQADTSSKRCPLLRIWSVPLVSCSGSLVPLVLRPGCQRWCSPVAGLHVLLAKPAVQTLAHHRQLSDAARYAALRPGAVPALD